MRIQSCIGEGVKSLKLLTMLALFGMKPGQIFRHTLYPYGPTVDHLRENGHIYEFNFTCPEGLTA